MASTMTKLLRAKAALLACAAIALGGCSSMPPYAELFDTSPGAEGTGIMGVGLVRAAVIIAKYQATDRQREVATQRARAVTRRLVARAESSERPVAKSRAPKPHAKVKQARTAAAEPPASAAESSRKPAPAAVVAPPIVEEEVALERKPAKRKLPRYIAVDTVPDARSKGSKSVMIWDTQAEAIVGNNVYDVATAPRMLETVKFETYSAEYVGAGL